MSDDVIGTRWSSPSQEDLRVSRKNISVERRFLANIFIKNGGTLGFLAMPEEEKIIKTKNSGTEIWHEIKTWK